jgi:hypothetical protein
LRKSNKLKKGIAQWIRIPLDFSGPDVLMFFFSVVCHIFENVIMDNQPASVDNSAANSAAKASGPDRTSQQFGLQLLDEKPHLFAQWLSQSNPAQYGAWVQTDAYRDWQRKHDPEAYGLWLRKNDPPAYGDWLREAKPPAYADWLRRTNPAEYGAWVQTDAYRDWQRKHDPEVFREWQCKNDPPAYGDWLRKNDPQAYGDWLREAKPDAYPEWLRDKDPVRYSQLMEARRKEQEEQRAAGRQQSIVTMRIRLAETTDADVKRGIQEQIDALEAMDAPSGLNQDARTFFDKSDPGAILLVDFRCDFSNLDSQLECRLVEIRGWCYPVNFFAGVQAAATGIHPYHAVRGVPSRSYQVRMSVQMICIWSESLLRVVLLGGIALPLLFLSSGPLPLFPPFSVFLIRSMQFSSMFYKQLPYGPFPLRSIICTAVDIANVSTLIEFGASSIKSETITAWSIICLVIGISAALHGACMIIYAVYCIYGKWKVNGAPAAPNRNPDNHAVQNF